MDMQCHLAGLCAEHNAFRLNEIADVEHFGEEIQPLLSQLVGAKEQLDFPGTILDMRKRDLAHGAAGADSSCQCNPDFLPLFFRGFEFRDCIHTNMCTLCARWIGIYPFGAQFFQFL
jgi:hypothetical protein